MGYRHIPDNKRTYEHLIGPIVGMVSATGHQISPETQKDLTVALKVMGYVDHQYDKKNQEEQEIYAKQMIHKLQSPQDVDMGQVDETFNELFASIEKRGVTKEFIFYSKKILAHNALACNTEDIKTFIKHKYLEGYTSAKIITLFLTKEGLDYEVDKLLCNLVAISNIFDDLLDIDQDFQEGVSSIKPSPKLKAQLTVNVIWHTITKFLLSGKINQKMVKYICSCTINHLHKKFFDKAIESNIGDYESLSTSVEKN